MTREELDELMLIYATGASDESETAEAESRLASGDPAAQASYAEALVVVNSLPLSLPLKQPPKAARDALLFRVTASQQAGSGAGIKRRSGWPAWIATGVAAALAVGLILTVADNRRIQGELTARLEQADQTGRVMSSPYVHLAKLTIDGQASKSEMGKPSGRLVFCPASRQYQLRVYRLAPPPPGRVYEMWLLTPDKTGVIPAGTFTVDAKGSGMHYVTLPKGQEYAFAAISDEPAGGSLKPTGSIHLTGALNDPPLDPQ